MKCCVVTGTRAEYGLLYWTMKALKEDPSFELKLCVTGMHLSPEFGLTYQIIEDDGFHIDKKIEMLLSSDTPIGISKSIGLGVISFAEAYEELQPDLILVLGDRYEIFAAVTAAMISKIPVAHCHGGEATMGLIDEPIRHSITKMSHFHFASTNAYRNRIIQLGELPENTHNVGALGIENINKLQLMSKEDFEESVQFKLDTSLSILITFHPVTLEDNSSQAQMQELLDALDHFEDAKIIFTKANSDTDGRIINLMIDEYVKTRSNAVGYTSLGQLRYLSAIQHVDLVLGNSSSGLLEVPSFKKATVNIGDRQNNRIKSTSVIDCLPEKEDIIKAIETSQSEDFQKSLLTMKSPYGEGNSSGKIIDILKNVNFDDKQKIIKKSFYDLK